MVAVRAPYVSAMEKIKNSSIQRIMNDGRNAVFYNGEGDEVRNIQVRNQDATPSIVTVGVNGPEVLVKDFLQGNSFPVRSPGLISSYSDYEGAFRAISPSGLFIVTGGIDGDTGDSNNTNPEKLILHVRNDNGYTYVKDTVLEADAVRWHQAVEFSPSGHLLSLRKVSNSYSLKVYAVGSGSSILVADSGNPPYPSALQSNMLINVYSIKWSPIEAVFPVFAASGTMTTRPGPDGGTFPGLFLWQMINGSEIYIQNIYTKIGAPSSFAWSADGKGIICSRASSLLASVPLVRLDLIPYLQERPMTFIDPYVGKLGPASTWGLGDLVWSPDGKYLFASSVATNMGPLYKTEQVGALYAVDDTSITRLDTPGELPYGYAVFSPDGRYLILPPGDVTVDGVRGRRNGSTIVRLTKGSYEIACYSTSYLDSLNRPVFTPDGEYLITGGPTGLPTGVTGNRMWGYKSAMGPIQGVASRVRPGPPTLSISL